MPEKTAATIPTLTTWLRSKYDGQIETDDQALRIADRESAGDDEPDPALMANMRRIGQEAEATFSNVTAMASTLDEWADLTLTIL
jgi:hypothetical protein